MHVLGVTLFYLVLGARALWSFSDVGGDVSKAWSTEAGGHDVLLERINSVIAGESPTIIYTFDPNHGSSCHPAHRAVGALVIEAVARKPIHA